MTSVQSGRQTHSSAASVVLPQLHSTVPSRWSADSRLPHRAQRQPWS
ncbi:hypothetical protein [Streptomyces sp. NPDC094472]